MAGTIRTGVRGRTRTEHDAAGVEGNSRLTGATAAVLFVLLAVEGVTILALDSLISVHVFIGVVLIPPALLKVGSTGYRMLRYYAGSAPYVAEGPPPPLLRLLGPVIVLSTGVLLATGVALLFQGPGDGLASGLHKLGFIVFFGSTAIHVLAHIRRVPALTAADWRPQTRAQGSRLRRGVLAVSLIVGLGLGAAAVAYDGAWVHRSQHERPEG